MPMQRGDTPAIASLERRIAAFSRLYHIDSNVFAANDGRSLHVEEDDAMEWSYLLEQLAVLRESAPSELIAH